MVAGLQRYLTIRWLGCGLAPKSFTRLFRLMAVVFLGLVSLNAHSDTYPPTRQYMIRYDITPTFYPTFEAAAQAAWNAYKIPSFWPSTVKLDWFTSYGSFGCQSKAEPVNPNSQGYWVDINTSHMSYADDNGNPYNPPHQGCSSIQNPVLIQLVCLYGGNPGNIGNGVQCFNAPPCPAPQIRDAATGACVDQETYTLTLKPDHPTTEPSSSLGLTVTVEDRDHQPPKNPVPVKISLKVDPTSGGHDHGDSTRPRGGIDNIKCETDDTCKTLSIGSEGSATITFKAPAASGIHTVTATCDQCSNGPQKAEIKVMVEGLSQIPSSTFYRRITPNADTNHPNTHFLKPEASAKLQKIAMAYYAATYLRKDGWLPNVMLNDASLEWGGVLDCYATCLNSVVWGPSHLEHRRGTVIDIRARIPGANTSHPETLLFEKEFIAQALKAGIDPGWPHSSGNFRHYHLQLDGKAE